MGVKSIYWDNPHQNRTASILSILAIICLGIYSIVFALKFIKEKSDQASRQALESACSAILQQSPIGYSKVLSATNTVRTALIPCDKYHTILVSDLTYDGKLLAKMATLEIYACSGLPQVFWITKDTPPINLSIPNSEIREALEHKNTLCPKQHGDYGYWRQRDEFRMPSKSLWWDMDVEERIALILTLASCHAGKGYSTCGKYTITESKNEEVLASFDEGEFCIGPDCENLSGGTPETPAQSPAPSSCPLRRIRQAGL